MASRGDNEIGGVDVSKHSEKSSGMRVRSATSPRRSLAPAARSVTSSHSSLAPRAA